MKEIHLPPPLIPITTPLSPVRLKEAKRWLVARSRTENKLRTWKNDSVAFAYHAVIVKSKELIMRSGGDTVFERDLKEEPTEYTGMHTFLTSSFYWRLDCELNYNYEVYYAFHDCPYEHIIRMFMKAYPLDRTTHEQVLQHGFEAFRKGVFSVQPSIHFTALKA